MRMLKVLCCAATLAVVTAPAAHAQTYEWTKKTYLTFSGPVQVPGKTLAAGTYTFRMADLLANRHVLQILDKDETDLIATVMTVPATRAETPQQNIVMFGERPAGQAAAVKMWYYPGNTIGNEFVYPRAQAMQIAKATHEPVLSSDTDTASDSGMKTAKVARIDESGNEVDDDGAAVAQNNNNTTTTTNNAKNSASANQAPARAQASASVGTSGQAPASEPAPRRRELPRTAGNLAMLELLSVLSAAGYFGTRRARKTQERA